MPVYGFGTSRSGLGPARSKTVSPGAHKTSHTSENLEKCDMTAQCGQVVDDKKPKRNHRHQIDTNKLSLVATKASVVVNLRMDICLFVNMIGDT